MEIFSTIDLVNQCLIDKERVRAFKKAILKYVKKNSVVLELGVGSGVLSLIAAKAGARRVYGVEIDPFVANTAIKNIEENGFDNIIEIITGDATRMKFNIKEKIDVVISEVLTTGMVDEQQVNIINNLHRQKIISPKTKIIPCRIDTKISLVEVNYKLYGFNFPMVRHLWRQYSNNPSFKVLSKKELVSSYYFNRPIEKKFLKEINFKIVKEGVINGLLIESFAWFLKDLYCTNTEAFLAPVIFPLEEIRAKRNQKFIFKISYTFGGGYKSFKAVIEN